MQWKKKTNKKVVQEMANSPYQLFFTTCACTVRNMGSLKTRDLYNGEFRETPSRTKITHEKTRHQGVVSNIGDELARNNSLANLRLVGGV